RLHHGRQCGGDHRSRHCPRWRARATDRRRCTRDNREVPRSRGKRDRALSGRRPFVIFRAATRVNVANATRGPLLLVSGARDNTVPPVLVGSALRAYGKGSAVTEFKEFAGRGHSLTIDSGWREVAEYSLTWLKARQL